MAWFVVHPSNYNGNINDHHHNIIMMEKCGNIMNIIKM